MSALDDSQPPTTETALPVDGSKAENGTNPPESVAEPEKATEPQVPPRPLPSDDALLTALRDILKDVDINSVTQGQVRLRLEEHFGQDLSEKKAYIREQLPGLLAERKLPPSPKPSEPKDKARKPAQPKRTAPASEESPAPTKKGRGMFGKELLLSPGLAEFMGETRMSRSEATKRVWAYIREHNLPKTKNKAIQLDGALEKALKRKTITFGSLAKALGANMKDEQWVSAPQSSKARTSTAPSDDDDDDDDEDEDEDEDDEDEGNE